MHHVFVVRAKQMIFAKTTVRGNGSKFKQAVTGAAAVFKTEQEFNNIGSKS